MTSKSKSDIKYQSFNYNYLAGKMITTIMASGREYVGIVKYGAKNALTVEQICPDEGFGRFEREIILNMSQIEAVIKYPTRG